MAFFHTKHLYIPLAFALLTAGCASTPNISLDKEAAVSINTIALLRVVESQQFMVRDHSGLPGLGGAIGGAIAGNIAADRSAKYIEAYNAGSTKLGTALVADLQRELNAAGKQVSYAPEEFAKLKNNVDDYSHIQTNKDGILSVWFGPVGYVADGLIDAPFEPWVVVHVRLLDAKTYKVLSQKTYSGGYQAKLEGAVYVPCGQGYRYDKFDKLMANFTASTAALAECEQAISRQAARDLK